VATDIGLDNVTGEGKSFRAKRLISPPGSSCAKSAVGGMPVKNPTRHASGIL
jgi:hypothetical protein